MAALGRVSCVEDAPVSLTPSAIDDFMLWFTDSFHATASNTQGRLHYGNGSACQTRVCDVEKQVGRVALGDFLPAGVPHLTSALLALSQARILRAARELSRAPST